MSVEPIKILIAALGGEGGGVLTNWIVEAATRAGYPVQSTSVPGVAQRTGATTYYVELLPIPALHLQGRTPVLALSPGPGEIDLLVASELMEAGRAISVGYPSADRTFLIGSTHRAYLVTEKTAMADGRYDPERLKAAAVQNSRVHRLLDLAALAKQSGAMINAVMLGAIAGSGVLPIAPSLYEEAIRAEGKAADANLRGFAAGLKAMSSQPIEDTQGGLVPRGSSSPEPSPQPIDDFPEAARAVIREGVRRLVEYQDEAYASLFLERLRRIAVADEGSGASGALLRETARHLALRMSYEDVIRVAQEKIDPARIARIAHEVGANGKPFSVTEFFSPRVEEFCSILPPRLAEYVLRASERRSWKDRLNVSMTINTTSITGYLRLLALAKLRRFRPHTYRYVHEQRAIDAWLDTIVRAARLSAELALEVAELARLIKGYGDTHERGSRNFALIEAGVVVPALGGTLPRDKAVDAIASARVAALADPEGTTLAGTLAELNAMAFQANALASLAIGSAGADVGPTRLAPAHP